MGMKVFELEKHRLGFGDSSKKEEVAELMGNTKADLFLIDPPYGVSYIAKNAAIHGGIIYNAVGKKIDSDEKSLEDIQKLWFSLAKNAYDFTTNEASYLWFACQGGDQMMMMMMIGNAGWKVRHELIWAKSSFVFGRSNYHYQHEPILYGWKKDGKHNFYGDRKQTSLIRTKKPNRSDFHPTSKPVELIEYLIKNHTKENDIVLDLCGGGGTTLLACERLNRRCFMMEIDEMYIKVIQERFNKFQKSLF
jgi:DNA modification methylase